MIASIVTCSLLQCGGAQHSPPGISRLRAQTPIGDPEDDEGGLGYDDDDEDDDPDEYDDDEE